VASWRVDRLSKGMSQKVQIASILLSDPEVCVLDEPTTGLDPVNVQIVEDLLVERRRNGRTTILSTHHMNQVESLCDRVAMINQGQLMVYGGVDEVRRRYSLPEIHVHAHGPIPAIAAVARVTEEGGGHYRLLLADGTPAHEVLAALVAQGAAVERFEPLLAPMEDIFVRVVREGRA
jgi:ABC-2 type transport system ATP-binding protein